MDFSSNTNNRCEPERLFERAPLRERALLDRLRERELTRRESMSAGSLLERHALSGKENRNNRQLERKTSLPLSEHRAEPDASKAKGLKAHLEKMEGIESTVAPLITDVLASMHAAEKRMRASAGHLEQHVNLEHRRKVVAWLVKAFHVVSFDDSIFYGTVQLADLYLSACPKYVCGSILQSVVMACVCTTLKLATPDHRVYSVPDLIAHITHSQITLERVLRVEREVLTGLDFNVSPPTIGMFLETFGMRLTGTTQFADWPGAATVPPVEAVVGGPSVARPKFHHLADYLCQLALLNHELLDFLPSELAGAALVLAVWALRGPTGAKAILLEDIRACNPRGDLQACVKALHREWLCPNDRDASIAVVEKFATAERQEVSDFPALAVAPVV